MPTVGLTVPTTLVKFGVGLSTPGAKFGAMVHFRSALQWGKNTRPTFAWAGGLDHITP